MRRKIIAMLIVAMLVATLIPINVCAVTASAWTNGPGTVRAGDTITVSFVLNGTGIYGATGTLSYDSSQLTLTGTSQSIGSPWVVEFNGGNFAAYDNNLSSPINSASTLFTATFKVNTVSAGTKIVVSFLNVRASDGNADANLGTVSYSVTIAAPLSTDNSLKSLSVSNATISPAFSPNVTSYSAQVPYEVSRLNVNAVANDGKASVSVDNPNLTANATTNVYITVTAENGGKKTYTISVKRAQDPNYIPSNNSKLESITVDGFLLSPVFDADNTQYVVWVPYEVDNVSVAGVAEHSLCRVSVEGGSDLVAGADNLVQVIGTAEDGSQTVYSVIVKRGPAHDSPTEETEPSTEATEPSTEPTEITEIVTFPPETEATSPIYASEPQESGTMTILLVVLAFAAGAILGGGTCLLLNKMKNR